jgi:hypothetical protein
MNEEKPPNGHRTFILRVVVVALGVVVAAEIAIILGHGVVCITRGGCGPEEWSNAGEMLAALLATLIALIFALIEGRKP